MRHVVLELDLEALSPGLEQVRTVEVADHGADDADGLPPLVTVTRIMSV